MQWRSWLARDSALWQVLFYGGLVVTAFSALPNPDYYGIPSAWMPYLRGLALAASIIGGKWGMSPAPLSRNLNGGTP